MKIIFTSLNAIIIGARQGYFTIIEQLAKQYHKHHRDKADKLIENILQSKPSCVYSDHCPKQTPEQFAEHFNKKPFTRWLLNNSGHKIWGEKNTSPLHITTRCLDELSITALTQQGYPINHREEASQLTAIELLFNTEPRNRSQALRKAQAMRMRHPNRQFIFKTLCAAGAELTLDNLIQIATVRSNHTLLHDASTHFIRQNSPKALSMIQQYLDSKSYPIPSIQKLIKQILSKSHPPTIHGKQTYSTDQLSILIHTVSHHMAQTLYQAHLQNQAHLQRTTPKENSSELTKHCEEMTGS